MAKYPMADGQEKHVLPLSWVRESGNLVFISGHGAVGENGDFVSDTFEGQMRYTMGQLQKTLEAAGMGWGNVIQVRSYVQHQKDIPLYNQLYREYLSEPYPARTTIVNCLPDGLLFEIDCIAER
ncbi:MAG: RidA family protein [Armatimonadaceae bacterium]